MTDADLAARFLADLEAAVGQRGREADARFREALDLLALYHADIFEPLDDEARARFTMAARQALLAQRDRLLDYLDQTTDIAADEADERGYTLCTRRSALQYLIEDHASTPVADWLESPALADLDARLRDRGERQGPIDADEVPENMPADHWWWFHPGAGEREADQVDLDALAHARAEAITLAAALVTVVEPILTALHHDPSGELVTALRPRQQDYAAVFDGALAAVAEAAFEALWAALPPQLTTAAASARLDIHVAPAGMLLEDNELSRRFPGGYRRLAPYLAPQRVWVAWKVIERGASSGVAYDGLVWVDDHWAWFPKPFRVLRSALDALDGAAA